MTIQDCGGRSTTYAQAPERVVTIDPSVTEMLLLLGLGDRIVGYTEFYPPEQQWPPVRADLAKLKLINDPATANSLNASLKNIEELTRQINSGDGTLGKLLKDDSFARSLTSATANLDTLVAGMNAGEGTIGKLAKDPALFNRLNAVTERLETLVNGLNQGEGTAGQLLKDKQLYENMNKVTNELSALIAEITKNPKKYLNVKVSIF